MERHYHDLGDDLTGLGEEVPSLMKDVECSAAPTPSSRETASPRFVHCLSTWLLARGREQCMSQPPSIYKTSSEADLRQCLPTGRTYLLMDMHVCDNGTARSHLRVDIPTSGPQDLLWKPSLHTVGDRCSFVTAVTKLSPTYLVADTSHRPTELYFSGAGQTYQQDLTRTSLVSQLAKVQVHQGNIFTVLQRTPTWVPKTSEWAELAAIAHARTALSKAYVIVSNDPGVDAALGGDVAASVCAAPPSQPACAAWPCSVSEALTWCVSEHWLLYPSVG